MTIKKYDVVVAGAGIAGCIVSKIIASNGFKVALVESKPISIIGMKVCGDGVGLHEFQEAGVTPPAEEIERFVEGVKFYTNSADPIFSIEGKGVTLNRRAFGQKLLKEAQDQNVELFSENTVTKAMIEDGYVTGIISKHNGLNKFKASITIDATGIVGAVRSTLPTEWNVAEKLPKGDIGIGYREFRQGIDTFEDYCSLYYDWEIAPGGYCWIIPKKKELVNTGVLIPWGDSINAFHLKTKFNKFVRENQFLQNSKVLRSEIGLVPLSHPLPNAVANGFLTIGDAACHTNPINGEGIGPAMSSARLASETIITCLIKSNNSARSLWKFNIEYMRIRGHRYSANKILRDLMMSLKPDKISTLLKSIGIKKKYYSSNFLRELTAKDKLSMLLKISSKPNLLYNFVSAFNRINALSSFCKKFPDDPTFFPLWLMKFNKYLNN